MQLIQTKSKEVALVSSSQLHSHSNVFQNNDLKGSRIRGKDSNAHLLHSLGQDLVTFTGTIQCFNKSRFYLDDEYVGHDIATNSYNSLDIDIPEFRVTLIQHTESVKKLIGERAQHKMDSVIIESNGTESKEQDTISRLGNDAHVDDADIRPIYNEEPMAEVISEVHGTRSILSEEGLRARSSMFMSLSLISSGSRSSSNGLPVHKTVQNSEFTTTAMNRQVQSWFQKLFPRAVKTLHLGPMELEFTITTIILQSVDNRFNTIITSLKVLDESFSSRNHVSKFLRALPTKWRLKDSEISKRKKEKYKSLALKARKVSSDEEVSCSDSDDEEYAMAEERKEKDDRRCFKCGDPNHFISECPQHSFKHQKAFVGGCWRDSEEDNSTKDEICLMALDNNEVLSDTPYYSSSLDSESLQNEYNKLCKISLRIINKNKHLKAKNELLNNEACDLRRRLEQLERNKEVYVECESCVDLQSKVNSLSL
ncbi:zf-CCHC domain-containing protein [Tanacetum coccineum]